MSNKLYLIGLDKDEEDKVLELISEFNDDGHIETVICDTLPKLKPKLVIASTVNFNTSFGNIAEIVEKLRVGIDEKIQERDNIFEKFEQCLEYDYFPNEEKPDYKPIKPKKVINKTKFIQRKNTHRGRR